METTMDSLVPSPVFTGPVADELTAAYHAAWGAKAVPGRNPAPLPVSLERRHLPLLREAPYVAADKSDGVRMCLFLTRVGGREHAVLVDRKLALYQVQVAASRRCFDGSLFDGELLWTTGAGDLRWQTFLVFDAVAWKGDGGAIGRKPLTRRLELIRHTFDLGPEELVGADAAQVKAKQGKIICGGNAHGLAFRPKQCFSLEMLPTLLRQLAHLPYHTDGLVLTPVNEPVRTGTHETTFKLKWRHTLDVQVNCATRQLFLGAGGGAHDERHALEDSGTGLWPSEGFWEAALAAMGPDDSPVCAIAECELGSGREDDDKGEELRFLRIRRDKAHPNTLRTAQRTLTSLAEKLSPKELLAELLGPGAR